MHEGRINLRLDLELIKWTKQYCFMNQMSMSGLVRELLLDLKQRDEELQRKHADAEQI